MGLLERMESLETPEKVKATPKKVSGTSKPKLKATPKLGAKTSDKNLKKFANVAQKPNSLAKAKEKSNSSLHTHLNKTDEHGISHKDRIEEELRLQVKKIKKTVAISVAITFAIIVSIILIVKLVGIISNSYSNSSSATQQTKKKKVSYAKLHNWANRYIKSTTYDSAKFDKVFADFDAQASEADQKSSATLKAKLKKLYAK